MMKPTWCPASASASARLVMYLTWLQIQLVINSIREDDATVTHEQKTAKKLALLTHTIIIAV